MKIHRPGSKPPPKPAGPGLEWWLARAGFFAVGVVCLAGFLHFTSSGSKIVLLELFGVGALVVAFLIFFKKEYKPGEDEPDPSEEISPMDVQTLVEAGGRWLGTNRLHDPHTNVPEKGPSTLTVRPMPGGHIVRVEQEWSYQGTPQEGHLLIMAGASPGQATAHWVDTWHQSTSVMILEQDPQITDRFSFFGRYPAPPGPDWGWRIELQPEASGTLRLTMINISPERKSTPAVEATYQRDSK